MLIRIATLTALALMTGCLASAPDGSDESPAGGKADDGGNEPLWIVKSSESRIIKPPGVSMTLDAYAFEPLVIGDGQATLRSPVSPSGTLLGPGSVLASDPYRLHVEGSAIRSAPHTLYRAEVAFEGTVQITRPGSAQLWISNHVQVVEGKVAPRDYLELPVELAIESCSKDDRGALCEATVDEYRRLNEAAQPR